jgi:hypothetical protein
MPVVFRHRHFRFFFKGRGMTTSPKSVRFDDNSLWVDLTRPHPKAA